MPSYRPANRSEIALKGLLGVALAGAVLPLAPSLANAASVRKEIVIDAPPAAVWEALRDFGAVHERLARGFVTDTRMEPDGSRIVTFANGSEAKELLVDIDDERMRLVYAAVTEQLKAHSASAQVFPEGQHKTRFVWMADFLPNELKPYIDGQMELGAAAIKNTLEEDAR